MDSQEARAELVEAMHAAALAHAKETHLPYYRRNMESILDAILAHPETVIAAMGGKQAGVARESSISWPVFVFPAVESHDEETP